MGAALDRIIAALATDRDPAVVIASLAGLFGGAAVLWLSACALMVMEPLS
ncbi:hypothetical protein [Sphingomonas melonis]